MKLLFKKQILYLMLHKASYGLTRAYLKQAIDWGRVTESCSLKECQEMLLSLTQFRKEIFSKGINFTYFNHDAGSFINRWIHQTLLIGDCNYPTLWYFIPQPPILIFYEGDLSLLKKPLVSIVGTRSISTYGEVVSEALTIAIADQNWAVVSGLAKGVDKAVHQSAVKHNDASTIGIIPAGLHYYYPKDNRSLEEAMYRRHLVLSEFLPFSRPNKHHFIMRNRLVAGISKATIIIEAAQQSGSLITANYALQYNREVFAVPGRITDKYSKGCNDLILNGARSINNLEQMIMELNEIFVRQGYEYQRLNDLTEIKD